MGPGLGGGAERLTSLPEREVSPPGEGWQETHHVTSEGW